MANIGHMNFFKVNQCGLYKPRGKDSHGCELDETFDLILHWAKNREMANTIPWSPHTVSKPKCYCREIYKDPATGDFVIVLWKSDSDSKGTLWGIEEDAANGGGEVVKLTSEHRRKKVIWGRPCYYWINPSQDTVVSIKFEYSLCDSQMFQDWVIACITSRVNHPKKARHVIEGGLTRLSFTDSDDEYKYAYRFDVSLRSLNTSSAELEELARTVTHIVKRETILINVQDHRAAWLKFFDNRLPFVSPKDKSQQRQIEIKAEARPTIHEMRDIIEKFAIENRKSSVWDNVGFLTAGGRGITWVDKYRLKNEISIPDLKGPGVIAAKDLFNELSNRRTEFIEPIAKSESKITSIRSTLERKVAGVR